MALAVGEVESVAQSYISPVGQCGSFQDLVQARHNSNWATHDPHSPEVYEKTLREFTGKQGEIIADYWVEDFPAAVAVTRQRKLGRDHLRLHRETTRLVAPR